MDFYWPVCKSHTDTHILLHSFNNHLVIFGYFVCFCTNFSENGKRRTYLWDIYFNFQYEKENVEECLKLKKKKKRKGKKTNMWKRDDGGRIDARFKRFKK